MSNSVSYLIPGNMETARLDCGFLLTMLLLLEVTAFLLSLYFSFQLILFIVGLLVFSITFTFSFERTLILLLSLIIIFQNPRYKFETISFAISPKIISMFIMAIFLFWILSFLLDRRTNIDFSGLSLLVGFFLVMVIIAAFIGMIHNIEPSDMLRELLTYFYFIVFFVVIDQVKNKENIKRIFATIIIGSIIVSFEYIYFFLTDEFTLTTMGRIITGQIHLLYLSMSFLLSLILWHRKKMRKFFILSLVPIIIAILISQTRGTWIACILAIISTVILFLVDKKVPFRKVIVYGLLLSAVISISTYLIATKLFSLNLGILIEARARTMLSVGKDASVLMRVAQNHAAWERIKDFPFLGEGLGSVLYPSPWYKVNWIDNTYLVLLWKFGIIGLFIFLGILALVLIKSLFIYRNTENTFHKSFAVGMFSTFFGFAILGFISPVLVKYRFNIVWAVLFGLTQVIETHVKKEISARQNKI